MTSSLYSSLADKKIIDPNIRLANIEEPKIAVDG